MRAVNEMKPINMLARFLAAWIRVRGSEAAPFNSFETLLDKPVEQKDIERWILNCNYAYYRVGDALLMREQLPDDPDVCRMLLGYLASHLKSIRDTNPLKLRSKQPAAIADELGKDWPPFCHGSRNDLHRILPALGSCGTRFAPVAPDLPVALHAIAQELVDEARCYGRILSSAPSDVGARCRMLVPIWCLKEVNPLFSLTIWQDERAVAELAQGIAAAFGANGYRTRSGGAHFDAYLGAVHASVRLYLDGLSQPSRAAVPRDFRELPIPEIERVLEQEFFALGSTAAPAGGALPRWLPGKALLIWNVVICSILGPDAAIVPSGAARTATTFEPAPAIGRADGLRGEVLLRRVLATGEREVVARVDLARVAPGTARPDDTLQHTRQHIWRVLGSSFDDRARMPAVLAGVDDVPSCFLPTNRFDALGRQIEGRGDSRYHAALSLEHRDDGWHLVLEDLGSKNGTYVVRTTPRSQTYLVLEHRGGGDAAAWASRLGTASSSVSMHRRIELKRGDMIRLCGSCFEIV